MKKRVLIIGENKRNSNISRYFAEKGYDSIIIEDVYQLRSLDGEAGCFTARLKGKEVEADLAVLTEQPSAPPAVIDGLQTPSVYEGAEVLVKSKANRAEPIVFLLDYICESPMSATICALDEAKKLACGKRRVTYLAKFIRTAGVGIEKLYREAREAGVTFVKYEDIAISANKDSEEFSITVSDGVLELPIKTKTVFVDAGPEMGARFAHAVKKLKLSLNEGGRLAEDMYYLAPALTGRRGVYYISRNLASEKLEEGLEYIAACAGSGIWTVPSHGTATVDGEKCVLCLNCLRACTHAALTPDTAARQMRVLCAACAGCGSCASVCPGNAITLEQENERNYAGGKSDKALVLCCENSAALAMEKALSMLGEEAALIETKSVPCGGRIGQEQLSDYLASYGKVMAAVCMDDACRHFDGNKRACRQVARLQNMLETAGLPSESVRVARASHVMPGVLRDDLIDLLRGD